MELAKEILIFLRLRNNPWTGPIPIMMPFLGALAVLTVGSRVAHFIYSEF